MPLRLLPALAAGLLLLAGCTPGPAQRPAPKAFGSETLFSQLERVVHFARSDAQSMDLLDPCTMRIRWSDGRERTYDLLRLRTAIPTEDDGERYALLLQPAQPGPTRMLVGTSQWGQYMMARSSIRQLKNLCALARQGQDYAGGSRRSASQGAAPRRRAATSP
ncbi:MAG: hypothetical protein ACO1OY_13730, partial [Ramlibacter sp.]